MSQLWIFIVFVLAGIGVGYIVPEKEQLKKALSAVQFLMLFFLMFLMGVKIGGDPNLSEYILVVGLQAAVLTIAVIAGSIAVTVLVQKLFFRQGGRFDLFYDSVKETEKQSVLKLALMVFSLVFLGYAAIHFGSELKAVIWISEKSETMVFIFLCIMVFSAGLDIGLQKNILSDIKRSGFAILMVPIATMLGSVLGAMIVGPLVKVNALHAGAAGSACGWYTLSGVVLTNIEPRLGALAFLVNLFREMITPIITPFVSKSFGPFAAVCPAGATSMDTMLGIIIRSTSPAIAIIAFSNGVILSSIVPGVLSLFIQVL